MKDNTGIKATGKALTRIASLYGAHRRWFGLEPDFMFRKRVYEKMIKFATANTSPIGAGKKRGKTK